MATRQSVAQCLDHCADVLQKASEQYKEASTQGHYHDIEYTDAQMQVEQAYQQLEHLEHSADAQQKEMLNRMRIQLLDLQHDMIRLDHDR